MDYIWQIRNWLSGCTQRVVGNASQSRQSSVTSGAPEESLLGPVLFNILITDADSQGHHQQVCSDTKLSDVVDTTEGWHII